MAVVDAAQQGLRIPNGSILKGFSKFEDHAGSQAHRPCEFSLTLSDRRVQVGFLAFHGGTRTDLTVVMLKKQNNLSNYTMFLAQRKRLRVLVITFFERLPLVHGPAATWWLHQSELHDLLHPLSNQKHLVALIMRLHFQLHQACSEAMPSITPNIPHGRRLCVCTCDRPKCSI